MITTNCTNKTKSDKNASSVLKISESEYDSITELNNYIGTYQIKAVHHLGKNDKNHLLGQLNQIINHMNVFRSLSKEIKDKEHILIIPSKFDEIYINKTYLIEIN